jgi:hypothetical protein
MISVFETQVVICSDIDPVKDNDQVKKKKKWLITLFKEHIHNILEAFSYQ